MRACAPAAPNRCLLVECRGRTAGPLLPNRLCALHGPPSIVRVGRPRRPGCSPSDAHLTGAAVGLPPLGCPHGRHAHRSGGRGARPARALTGCRRGAPRPAGAAAATGGRTPPPPSAVAAAAEAATAMTGVPSKGRSRPARGAGGRAVQAPLHPPPRRRGGLALSAATRDSVSRPPGGGWRARWTAVPIRSLSCRYVAGQHPTPAAACGGVEAARWGPREKRPPLAGWPPAAHERRKMPREGYGPQGKRGRVHLWALAAGRHDGQAGQPEGRTPTRSPQSSRPDRGRRRQRRRRPPGQPLTMKNKRRKKAAMPPTTASRHKRHLSSEAPRHGTSNATRSLARRPHGRGQRRDRAERGCAGATESARQPLPGSQPSAECSAGGV